MELEFHQLDLKYEKMRIFIPGLQARLMTSIAQQGQHNPVLVVSSDDKYVLIDGYRRVSALQTLGRDAVEAIKLDLDEISALVFCHSSRSVQNRSAFEDGWLVQDLVDIHGMSQADISKRLQRSESWVSRRLSLVRQLPESIQDLVRSGDLGEHAAMRYLVPLARAKRSDSEQLAKNLAGNRISSRQMARVYEVWKHADTQQRKRVVEQPMLFLKVTADTDTQPNEQPVDDIYNLAKDMEIITAVSARARQRLGKVCTGFLPEHVLDLWRSCCSSFTTLSKKIQEIFNVGS